MIAYSRDKCFGLVNTSQRGLEGSMTTDSKKENISTTIHGISFSGVIIV
jgi:hypothetical protein